MKTKSAKRIFCDLILFCFLIWAPWYAVLALIFAFNIIFRSYWEGALAGLAMDSFYSLPEYKFYAVFGMFTAIALIAAFVCDFLRSKIRLNV